MSGLSCSICNLLSRAQVSLVVAHGLQSVWAWGMWDLSSPTRNQTHAHHIGKWILNHWIPREVLKYFFPVVCLSSLSAFVEGKSFCLNCFMMSPMHLQYIFSEHLLDQWINITLQIPVHFHYSGNSTCSLYNIFKNEKESLLEIPSSVWLLLWRASKHPSCLWLDLAFFPLVPDITYWNAQSWLTL